MYRFLIMMLITQFMLTNVTFANDCTESLSLVITEEQSNLAKKTLQRILSKADASPKDIIGHENWTQWDNHPFTNPEYHDPNSFSYIIHGIRLSDEKFKPANKDLARLKNPKASKLLKDPEKGFQRQRIFSASFINETFPNALYHIGFILSVPGPSLVSVAPRDFGSRDFDGIAYTALEHNSEFPVVSPQRLIKYMSNPELIYELFEHMEHYVYKFDHNELLIVANKGIQIVGGFISYYPNETIKGNLDKTIQKKIEQLKRYHEDNLNLFLEYLKRKKLPLIPIQMKPQI